MREKKSDTRVALSALATYVDRAWEPDAELRRVTPVRASNGGSNAPPLHGSRHPASTQTRRVTVSDDVTLDERVSESGGDGIRTHDFFDATEALYRTELHPRVVLAGNTT